MGLKVIPVPLKLQPAPDPSATNEYFAIEVFGVWLQTVRLNVAVVADRQRTIELGIEQEILHLPLDPAL